MGDRLREAQALNNLGVLAYDQGAYEEARAYYEQCLVIDEEMGNRIGAAIALSNLAEVCIAQGQDSAAWDYTRRGMREEWAMQDTPHTLTSLVHVAHLHARAGQPEQGAELLGLALRHPASYSEVQRDAQPVLKLLREKLGAEQLQAALARGAELDLEQVVEEILRET
jgi:tetratricopeptide (TPR) repeat protein